MKVIAKNLDKSSISEYLVDFPWDERFLHGIGPLNFLWQFDLDASTSQLWPYLIDTSSFNKAMGIPEMFFEEREGKLFGKSKNAGVTMEWEEVPWQWVYLRELNNARIYSRGVAHYVRTRYTLTTRNEGGTTLIVYFGWVPSSSPYRILLSLGMRTLRKQYSDGLQAIVDHINSQKTGLVRYQTSPDEEPVILASTAQLEKIRKELAVKTNNPLLVDKLMDYVLSAEESLLYRIRVKELANSWAVDLKDLLAVFLYGCYESLFTLSWDVVCPHCRGVRSEVSNLGEMPAKDSCEVCEIEFDANQLNSIEVSFHVHPGIRQVQKRFYCAAEPATKQHILIQKSLAPKSSVRVPFTTASGVYRMRIAGQKKYSLLEVSKESLSGEGSAERLSEKANLSAELNWSANPNQSMPDEASISSFPDLYLQNPTDQAIIFIVEERKEDQLTLRPADLFNFQKFRDLFSQQSVAADIQLDIGVQTILFTDIVGSTKFYATEGDAKAFVHIRQHFVEVYRIVREFNGAVVKTIGDAIMASFSSPYDAFQASVSMQKSFSNADEENPIRIRISMHSGPCLAVNLNSNIDYFGNTVNMAAKLQGATGAGEITVSESLLADLRVSEALMRLNPKKLLFKLESVGAEMKIRKLNLEQLLQYAESS